MRAIFFNPTNLRISALKTILSVFDGYVEIKNGPLGLKYMKAGRAHAVQAISHKRSAKKFKQYIKKIVYAMQYSGFRHMFEKNPQVTAVIWNGRSGVRHIFIQAAKDAGVKTLFLELSPLPNSITVDPLGINFENSQTVINAGANVLVSGSTIFKQNNGDLKKNISLLRSS